MLPPHVKFFFSLGFPYVPHCLMISAQGAGNARVLSRNPAPAPSRFWYVLWEVLSVWIFCKPVSPCRSHPIKTAHHSLFPDAIKPMMIRNIIAHTIIRVKLSAAVRVEAIVFSGGIVNVTTALGKIMSSFRPEVPSTSIAPPSCLIFANNPLEIPCCLRKVFKWQGFSPW